MIKLLCSLLTRFLRISWAICAGVYSLDLFSAYSLTSGASAATGWTGSTSRWPSLVLASEARSALDSYWFTIDLIPESIEFIVPNKRALTAWLADLPSSCPCNYMQYSEDFSTSLMDTWRLISWKWFIFLTFSTKASSWLIYMSKNELSFKRYWSLSIVILKWSFAWWYSLKTKLLGVLVCVNIPIL